MAVTIGQITAESDGEIVVTNAGQPVPAEPARETQTMADTPQAPQEPPAPAACCAGAGAAPAETGDGTSTAQQTQTAWLTMMRSAGSAGALDERSKELINFALVCMARCGPCIRAHYDKAIAMGITPDELREAMWCAVFIGGAPVRLFYEETIASIEEGAGKDCCGH